MSELFTEGEFVVVVATAILLLWLLFEFKGKLRFSLKNSKGPEFNSYDFIESPQTVQIRIQVETVEGIEQVESVSEMANVIWKYNEMKDEVKKVKEMSDTESLIAAAKNKIGMENKPSAELQERSMIYMDQEGVGADNEYQMVPKMDNEAILDELAQEESVAGDDYDEFRSIEDIQ